MTDGEKPRDMKVSELELCFGSWTSWKERRPTPTPLGGVYLLGYFTSPPPLTPLDPERLPYRVIYVGDAKNLNSRPLTGSHHQAGPGLDEVFGEGADVFLYVAIGPLYVIDIDAKRYAYQRTRSFYIEMKLAWDYARIHGHPPILQVRDTIENRKWIAPVVVKLKERNSA